MSNGNMIVLTAIGVFSARPDKFSGKGSRLSFGLAAIGEAP